MCGTFRPHPFHRLSSAGLSLLVTGSALPSSRAGPEVSVWHRGYRDHRRRRVAANSWPADCRCGDRSARDGARLATLPADPPHLPAHGDRSPATATGRHLDRPEWPDSNDTAAHVHRNPRRVAGTAATALMRIPSCPFAPTPFAAVPDDGYGVVSINGESIDRIWPPELLYALNRARTAPPLNSPFHTQSSGLSFSVLQFLKLVEKRWTFAASTR